jgi:hypothetical protein
MRFCVSLSPRFLVSYWSAGFGTFLQVSALASQWLEDCGNFTPTPEKTDQYSANTLSAIPAALHNNTPLVIGKNEKISS